MSQKADNRQRESHQSMELVALLGDPTKRIEVRSIVDEAARSALASLEREYLINRDDPARVDPAEMFESYRVSILPLVSQAVIGVNQGDAAHFHSWIRVFKTLARNPGPEDGRILSTGIWHYPAVYAAYALAIAALERGDLSFLVDVLLKLRVEQSFREGRVPVVAAIAWTDLDQVFERLSATRYHTPLSEHLFEVMPEVLGNTVPDKGELEWLFDLTEYAIDLMYLKAIGIVDDGFFWAPLGRYMWRGKRRRGLMDELRREMVELGAVELIFGRDPQKFEQAHEALQNFTTKLSFH